MQGHVTYFADRAFPPRYFGHRFFRFAIAANHTVTVGKALRLAVVPAANAAPGMPEAGRVVTVPSVLRSVGVPAAVRMVTAVTPVREVTI